jgi:hypothetical protein
MDLVLFFIIISSILGFRSVWAFNTSFTPPTQCGPLTITWNATQDTQTGPPYKLLIIPVNGPSSPLPDSTGLGQGLSLPVVTDIPDSAWDATTRSGTFTIQQLPLKTGEHFVIIMDDGFGACAGIHFLPSSFPAPLC